MARAGVMRRLTEIDVFPEFSARARRFVATPLGVLALGCAAAVLCGLALHPRVFALAGGLAAVVAAGVCWPWLTLRGVTAAVAFDRARAVEGDPVGVSAEVTNRLPWPAWGLTAGGGFGPADAPVLLTGVAGRSVTTFRWEARPPARGVYPLDPPRLATGFPFGLRDATRPAAVGKPLVVWPRTLPVGPVPDGGGEEAADGAVNRHRAGTAGDLVGVRPYRRGDSPRRIHWAQSARHDKLIVCEVQSAARPVVLLVLDADPAVHTAGPDGSREWAVRVVASLARGWLAAGARVGAAWDGAVLPPEAGAGQVTRILDALARLPGHTRRPLADVLRAAPPAGVRVAVTTDAARPPAAAGVKVVALSLAGFPGDGPRPPQRCDEGPPRPRPWLELAGPAELPRALRYGWSEARHGS